MILRVAHGRDLMSRIAVGAVLLAVALLAGPARGREAPQASSELAAQVAGSYVLIGRRPDSDETFVGRVVLTSNGSRLAGYREIDKVKTPVSATIEHPSC